MATTSSFFCSSPWTFVEPAEPSGPVRPARASARAMRLPATPKRMSSSDSSPVAPGEDCCSSRMKRSSVIGAARIVGRGYFFCRVIFQRPVVIGAVPLGST